ncbi:MAG: hypothetical protein B7X57_10805 [Erythrobacter sp. 34-65-8]|nr:MAG: hypothetical protein B7X57_10805 [Erythrobacter sp. 34-65-8]
MSRSQPAGDAGHVIENGIEYGAGARNTDLHVADPDLRIRVEGCDRGAKSEYKGKQAAHGLSHQVFSIKDG